MGIVVKNHMGKPMALKTASGEPVTVGSRHPLLDNGSVKTINAADYGHRGGGSYATVDTNAGSFLIVQFGFELVPQ